MLFGGTKREAPKDEESKNAILLLRGGYINKTMAGVYSFLPLGLRVMKRIEGIVREEMNSLPRTQEILMPAMQPKELWEESGRWADYKEDMYRLENETMGLGPTHEEVVTDLFRNYVQSYKDLPISIYQIQNKFRRELRAKSGLLRGREFLMKDMYSFHINEEDLITFHNDLVRAAYFKIYERCGLHAILTFASGGLFSKFSDEFQVICETGEDTIYLSANDKEARNKEIVPDENDSELLQYSGGSLKKMNGIEVGNIFKLGQRYTKAMNASVLDEKGETVFPWMGCYGIGISRVMGSVVEVLGDISGKIVWPKEIAPFSVHLIDLTPDKQGEVLYNDLHSAGARILYDDRDASPGEKFADADLIGAPLRVIISKRSLEAGGVEVKDLHNEQTETVSLDTLKNRIGSL